MKINRYIVAFITLLALIVLPVVAQAQTHRVKPLLSGSGMVLIDNNTTNLVAANRIDQDLWVNVDGTQPNIGLLLSGIGTNAAATNVVTVALALLPDGTNAVTSGGTNSYSFQLTGTTRATVLTNITTTFGSWVGARKVRCTTLIANDQPGNATGFTVQASIVGFVP